jgi:ribonuclease HI
MDANGHSPFWGPADIPSNAVGRALEDVILEQNLEVINALDAPPTFVSDGGAQSWIDVTLATRSAALAMTDWRVNQDFFSGSDHRAICFSLTHAPVNQRTYRCKDWGKVDWTAFREAVAQGCRDRAILQSLSRHPGSDERSTGELREEADSAVASLTEVFQGAIDDLVPEKRICWASKPWWSPQLTELRRHMKHLRNRADRLNTDHDRGLFRKARKAFTREVKKAKAAAWRRFCESVNHDDMWPSLQRILKPRQRLQVADLHVDEDQWAVEDSDKAEVLRARFFPEPPTSQAFQEATVSRKREVESWLSAGGGEFPHVQEFEVKRKLLEMRAVSAPGADGILAKCLQECSGSVTPVMQAIFNLLVCSGTHPATWRAAKVVPIPKPGGDLSVAKGYRPIALINTMSKVMEGLVADRLSFIVETRQLLSDHQQGFRQARATDLALWRFVNAASRALQRGLRCTSVALDIQAAYDSVDHTALLWKLKRWDVPQYLVAWIGGFLFERATTLVVNEIEVRVRARAGVPQGSPLSPLLFIIFINDLVEGLATRVSVSAFADDVLIWDISSSKHRTPDRMQAALDFITDWSETWGLVFDAAKCKALDVHIRRNVERLHLSMDGRVIPQVDVIKYLGVWIDCRLSWRKHVETTCNTCLQRLHAIRKLCATHWGMHPAVVSTLVEATVFPRLWYGVTAWGSVVKTQTRLEALDRVLRLSAVITLSLLRTTSTVKAIAVCGWLPADLHIRFALLRFVLRQRVYGRTSLGLELGGGPGQNRIISTADVARRELAGFRRACPLEAGGIERVDGLRLWPRPPWETPPMVPFALLPRDEAQAHIDSLMGEEEGRCIFTDGSVLRDGGNGAAAVFFQGGHAGSTTPTPSHTLLFPMGPLLASTDAEVGGIRGALRWLQLGSSPGWVTLVTDSQAALSALAGSHWRRCRESVWATLALHQDLWAAGVRVRFWWAPGHCGVAGNEMADREARRAAQDAAPSPLLDTWCNGRLLERRILQWYQDRAGRQEGNMVGEVLDSTEDAVIRSDLRWTRDLPSRYAAALVGQFLTGHFPTRVYLARFRLVDSALCTACGCPDTRAHLLLDCVRFSYDREYFTSWLREEFSRRTRQPGGTCPGWDWDFLTGSSEGRLWLSRFLRATRRGRGRWDDLEATLRREQEGSAVAGGAGADAGAVIADTEDAEEDDCEDMEED